MLSLSVSLQSCLKSPSYLEWASGHPSVMERCETSRRKSSRSDSPFQQTAHGLETISNNVLFFLQQQLCLTPVALVCLRFSSLLHACAAGQMEIAICPYNISISPDAASQKHNTHLSWCLMPRANLMKLLLLECLKVLILVHLEPIWFLFSMLTGA